MPLWEVEIEVTKYTTDFTKPKANQADTTAAKSRATKNGRKSKAEAETDGKKQP